MIILLIFYLSPQQLYAQKFADSVKWRIYVTAFDSVYPSYHAYALLGFHTQARYGLPYDTLYDFTDRWKEFSSPGDTERDWPPPPPNEDIRFNNPRATVGFGNQYHIIHPYTSPALIDTFRMIWLDGFGQSISTTGHFLTWPSPSVLKYYADSMFIRVTSGSTTWLNIDMLKDSSWSPDPEKDTVAGGTMIPTNNLRVIVYHPKLPLLPPDSVMSLYPPNGTPDIWNVDTLQWQPIPQVTGTTTFYRVQIATDRTFKSSSIVFHDSTTRTRRRYILPHIGWYYWRVKAFTPYGVGIYTSVVDSFHVSSLVKPDTIIASAGPHGSISPAGIISLTYGSTQTFSLIPAEGYHVDTLLVDGVLQPPAPAYTFSDVDTDHTITVSFAINHYTITSSGGPNGVVIPSGIIDVIYGDSLVCIARPDTQCIVDSLMVDGAYRGHDTIYVFKNITSNHTFTARFAFGSTRFSWSASEKWNLLSVPLKILDYRTTTIFPTATAGAFTFYTSYLHADTLSNGKGYWLRFSGNEVFKLRGFEINADTIPVTSGWNLIGSISLPVSVSDIICSPAGMITSNVFEYDGGYIVTGVIRPGYGYWIKTDQPGELILTSSPTTGASHIRIAPTGEQPPSPPDAQTFYDEQIPKKFALDQNYPNPFNPITSISYSLPERSFVRLTVYTILGSKVRTLQNGYQDAGYKSMIFDSKDLPSGIYFYRLNAGNFIQTKKMIMMK